MTDPTSALAQGLSGTYLLERVIGEGGMATVHLARDLKHQRPVALKVLKPELAQSLGPERFRREVTTAARLQHPHILSVFDSGETAGQLWFTMPFVRGESLRDRLRREGRLPVEEALRITREAAQALQYAHDEGIVHRDVKPENILLSKDGSTLVADFGIARALGAEADTGTHLTMTGTSIGTPTYMAPEQATGQGTVDARADQYSLAATLYEMLAGEPPFTATTAAALVAKRFTSPAPSVRGPRPEVPSSVDLSLQKALALRADERFASIGEFARAVTSGLGLSSAEVQATSISGAGVAPVPARRVSPVAVGAVVVAALGLGGVLLVRRPAAPAPAAEAAAPERMRLAVLPFENLGDSADAYFADGIADELRGKLTSVPGLEVIARSSSVQYRGAGKSPQEIARELGVRYLLTGTVRWEKAGGGRGRVRVSPELIEIAPSGAPASKWQQPFDAPLTDVFSVQTSIAEQVTRALDVALATPTQETLAQRPTADLAAYDAFLRAEAAWQGGASTSPEHMVAAEKLYEEAVRRDTAFAAAWSKLAVLRGLYYNNVSPRPAVAARAREARDRALALAPGRIEAVLANGAYTRLVEQDPARARQIFAEGVARSPGRAELLRGLGAVEQQLGDFAAARRRLEEAARLDPRVGSSVLTNNLLWLRDYPAARVSAERAWALAANGATLQDRVMIELAAGDLARARAIVAEGISRLGRDVVSSELSLYWDTYWALEPEDRHHVLGLGLQWYGDEPGMRALTRTQVLRSLGDTAASTAMADSAIAIFRADSAHFIGDAQLTTLYGLLLAYAGRREEARAATAHGLRLADASRDFATRQYVRHQAARVWAETGEPDRALDILEQLLKEPYYLSPGWLRLDPTLAALRGHPRFERLAASRPVQPAAS